MAREAPWMVAVLWLLLLQAGHPPGDQFQAGEHLHWNPIRASPVGGALPWELSGSWGRAGQGGDAAPPPPRRHPLLRQTFLGLGTRRSRSWQRRAAAATTVSSAAPRAGGSPAPGRPVARGPRACGSRRGPPLPGSAARASVSGEWGAGLGRVLGRAWGGRFAGGPPPGPAFRDCQPGTQIHSLRAPGTGPSRRSVAHLALSHFSPPRSKKPSECPRRRVASLRLRAGGLGAGSALHRCCFSKLGLTAVGGDGGSPAGPGDITFSSLQLLPVQWNHASHLNIREIVIIN